MGLFTLCSCLKTKESYDRWITRRIWGFRHQISKKMSVANIGKLQENFTTVQDGCEISQHEGHHFAAKGWFRSPRNWPSALCDRLPMALTPSCQLWIEHCLKRWIDDFPRFKMKYSMHEMDSRKCSKSVQQFLSSWILRVRFLSLHSWFAYVKGL